jgi:hypothetical protein
MYCRKYYHPKKMLTQWQRKVNKDLGEHSAHLEAFWERPRNAFPSAVVLESSCRSSGAKALQKE